jgi:CubicO group peptidase (beta-lactamase class C family)
MSVAGAVEIQGHAEAGFETLVEVFAENWDLYDEIGAGFCLYVDGDEKVSIWGGLADPAAGRPWQEDTMAVTFSATKGVTAICIHHLAEQNRIDLDAPVARYWPEFGAAGKANISIRWVLSHRAGLFSIEAPLTLEEVLAVRPVADALAQQAPAWEPGSAHLYHPLSYGYILGELVRRVTGKTLARYVREDIGAPIDADVWIGLPADQEHRVARLFPATGELQPDIASVTAAMAERDSAGAKAFLGNVFPAGFLGEGTDFNSPEVHASEIPAAGGIASGRGLARLYAATVGDVDGTRLLRPATMEAAREVQSEGPPLGSEVAGLRLSMGFQLDSQSRKMLTPDSFGHYGFGGSVGIADPGLTVGFGYVPNQLRGGMGGDIRPRRLMEEVGRLLDERPTRRTKG